MGKNITAVLLEAYQLNWRQNNLQETNDEPHKTNYNLNKTILSTYFFKYLHFSCVTDENLHNRMIGDLFQHGYESNV